MKKFVAILLAAMLSLSALAAVADTITIAVPNDPTNEGRALQLLQANGILTLKEGVGLNATKNDIESFANVEIEIYEVNAELVPNVRTDVDYAIINSNYAIQAGLNPAAESLLVEDAIGNPYINVVSVKEGNEDSDAAKALAAAVLSQQVVDYINATYSGSVISSVAEPTDGYDATVNYEALAGTTISIAATPNPHVEILNIAKEILAAKNVNLEIIEVTDYITPNTLVEDGDVFANYFAHQPYQDNFNAENNSHLVTVAGIHIEPLGLYSGRQADLTALGIQAK